MAKVFAYKGNIIGGGIGEDIKVTQTGSVSTNADYEILLSKSANDTTETDTVNKASGLTYNPSTNQLKINGTAVLTQHQDISGKVNKSGDTMTDNLLLKQSGIDASKTNNNVSTTHYPTTFCVLDTASRILARQEGVIDSSGNIGSYWYVRNYDTSAVQVAQKGLKMTMNKRGDLTWAVDDPANFRHAIASACMIDDSYPTLLPRGGSNGWIKIGTANTSYGIIPSQSGAAGSGHNNIGSSSWYWANAYIDNIYGKLNGSCTGSAGSVAWGNVTGKPSTYPPSSHSHSYLPLSGGTLTGNINWNGSSGYSSGLYWKENGYGDQFKLYPQFSGSDDSNYLCIATAVGGAGTSPSLTERFKFYPSGNLSCPVLHATSYIQSDGGIELRASTNYIDFHINKSTADYTARIIESSSGKLTAYNSISNSSDERLKKDIKELDDKYLHLLDKIDAKQFRYKKGDEYLFAGFIAQEFEAGLQEAGITDLPVVTPPTEADAYYGLDYSQVTAILWKICQNQEQRIKELESTIK